MLTTLLELHYDVTLRDIEGNNAMAAARCPEQARPQGSLTHQETHQETHLIHWAIVGIQWIQWMSRMGRLDDFTDSIAFMGLYGFHVRFRSMLQLKNFKSGIQMRCSLARKLLLYRVPTRGLKQSTNDKHH